MKDPSRVVTIIVGVVIAFLAYNFWFGSGVFAGWFAPDPPQGFTSLKLAVADGNPEALRSAGTADILSKSMEILFAVISWVGLMGITIGTKVIGWISSAFGRDTEPMTASDAVSQSPQALDIYAKVLVQAALDGHVEMCSAALNKIHGEAFIECSLIKEIK